MRVLDCDHLERENPVKPTTINNELLITAISNIHWSLGRCHMHGMPWLHTRWSSRNKTSDACQHAHQVMFVAAVSCRRPFDPSYPSRVSQQQATVLGRLVATVRS